MALPADRFTNINTQQLNDWLVELENDAKKLNPKIYMTYQYADERLGSNQVKNGPGRESQQSYDRRKLRILGCMLNVAWNTSTTQTRTDIATAVGALSV